MAHLTIQYSPNLESYRLTELCSRMNVAMQKTGIFPTGGIRVRAHPVEHWSVADEHPANAFVDMLLRMGAGRTDEEKQTAGDALMAVAEDFFSNRLAEPHFALALEIREIGKSWKTNTIHARLKADTKS